MLAPGVLEALMVKRRAPAISINEMIEVAKLPWGEQMGRVFNWGGLIHLRRAARCVWPPLAPTSRLCPWKHTKQTNLAPIT
jgi:hypothetical protein